MWVVVLTAVTMVVEIIFGITTRSMALLADGIAAIISSLVIIRWSVGLLKDSGKSLLDMHH